MNLVLIGYRGTGKSRVAVELAARLHWLHADADTEIERRAGKSVARIFAEDGEPAFRDLESQVVAELAARDRHVIALGGGAVMREQNRAALAQQCCVVWLTASPATLWQRLASDTAGAGRRPNLTSQGGLEEIETLLALREPVYRACAQLQIDTEHRTPAEVAEQILQQAPLNRAEGGSRA